MAVAKAQLPMEGLKTQAERDAEEAEAAARREGRNVLRVRLMSAIKNFCRGQVETVAGELDKDSETFAAGGKGVSASLLRACLTEAERNYFRLDWLFFLAEESKEVADVLAEIAGVGKPVQTQEQYIRDLEQGYFEELSSKRAEMAIRKARLK